MSDLNRFLKVLQKVGYPNSSLTTYAKIVDYDLEDLFEDLIEEVGEDKANEFVWNALMAMYEGDKGIRINLDVVNATGAYAYFKVSSSRIDLEESHDSTLVVWSWGDSHIATVDEDGQDEWKTIQEAWEDIGMGEWGDFDNFIDEVKEEVNTVIHQNCGFYVWFDTEE
jgi:hypothetical protein